MLLYDQVWFIQRMHVYFNIWKLVSFQTNRKRKNHIIISTDAEGYDKIQHIFLTKTFRKVEIERYFLI